MRIGDKVWRFDSNRRVYDGKGLSARVVWREHWCPMKVIGETRKSWLVFMESTPIPASEFDLRRAYKIPKKSIDHRGWAFSETEINDLAWVERHRHRISTLVDRCDRHTVLRQIAAMLDYKEEP